MLTQHMIVGLTWIRIRNDNICADFASRFKANARYAVSFCQDLINRCFGDDLATLINNNASHCIRQFLDPSLNIMHAKFFFQMADQNVHRGHVPRITANEQRVKRKRHAKARIFYAFCSMLINRLIGAQSDKARQFLDQVPQFIQRPTPQPFKSKCVTLFTVFQKSLIACKIKGENPTDLCIHILL